MLPLLPGQIGSLLRTGVLFQLVQAFVQRVHRLLLCRHGDEGAGRHAEAGRGSGAQSLYPNIPCGHVNPRVRRPSAGRRDAGRLEGTGEQWAALAVSQSAERL
ncbi:hypothetical protein GCM10010313_19900 [Streptomyces violarus]|nr:hypothetical protein GCM10010313_19900 [Streptomyces violarus]